MEIKRLWLKNFGAYGNIEQTIEFDSDNSASLNLIAASNGSGKTTLINALRFVLYGKTGEVSQGDLVNRINKKGTLVGVDVEVQNKKIKIERGILPSVLKVEVDGVKLTNAGKKNIQDFIEDEILKLPFSVFSNLISLSMADFKSFIDMKPADKRNIIDKMFGFDVINIANKKIKEKKSKIESDIKTTTIQCEEKRRQIEQLKDRINNIVVDDTDYTKINDTLTEEIAALKIEHTTEKEKLEKVQEKKVTIDNGIRTINQQCTEYYSNIKSAEKQLNLYKNDKCPTCGTDLTSGDHVHLKESLETERKKNQELYDEHQQKINENRINLNKCNEFINTINSKITRIVTEAKNKRNEIENNTKRAANDADKLTKEFNDVMTRIQNEVNELESKNIEYTSDLEYYKILIDDIFSDSGVKSILAKRIISPLNRLISGYVDYFEFDKYIEFNDNFDIIVKHLGEDINAKTLSLGERKISDLILILSFLELIKLQYPKLNVMFLDELFSSLDMNNINKVVAILKQLTMKYKFNIFVVSHADIEIQHFNRIINIVKSNGFSKIKEKQVI